MVGVDRPDAAVAEQVVAREQQLAEPERKLAAGVARRVPDFKFQLADADLVAVFHQLFDLHGRHLEVNILGGDLGEGHQLVARFQRLGRKRVAGDRRFENLLRLGETLDVVHIGMRGDQRDALREWKIELANDLQAVVDRVFITRYR